MAKFEILMPKMGESITEATITRWLKKAGEQVKEDESLAEIATDKVDSEIPSPVDGILVKILFKEGDVVPVETIIAVIDTETGETTEITPQNNSTIQPPPSREKTEIPISNVNVDNTQNATLSPANRFYSPLVKNIAKEEGISERELDSIPGTGKDQRLTKDDVLNWLKTRNTTSPISQTLPTPQAASGIKQAPSAQSPITEMIKPGDEIIEMDRIRKLIADHMVMSENTSVHVTSVIEADVTGMVLWREKNKTSFEKRENEKLTYTPIFIQAITKAITDYPMLNVSLDNHTIIKHKNINIGMATALPSGNLIVPVIKYADRLSLIGLTKQVNDLAQRARDNKLMPDEIQAGTFTLTNLGTFGTIIGTPIINQPQVAILGVGAIKKKPVVIESPHGDTIGIRSMMYLSLSYDHRIIDGALGGMFLKRIAEYLENFDTSQGI